MAGPESPGSTPPQFGDAERDAEESPAARASELRDASDGSGLDAALEAELLACLEAEDVDAALDEVCQRRPEQALKLRKVWSRMQAFGLEPEPRPARLPASIGHFEVLEKLGEGGMGVVYRCRQANPAREVAVKVVRPELLHFEGKRARFDREILAMAKLSHPGIVPVLEVGEDGFVPYYSMEFVVGASLASVLQRLRGTRSADLRGRDLLDAIVETLAPRDRSGVDLEACARLPIFCGSWTDAMLSIVTQVARALEHAHARDVLHRDVKPSNIMLTPDGRALLLDFGLARVDSAKPGDQELTRSTSSIGSLPYMAPEALRGETIDARVDVYALGVTFYEALAIRYAFVGSSTEETRANVLRAKPPTLRSCNASVTWDVETVCSTAMAPERAARYASMAALSEDLDRVRARLPIEARRAGAFLRLRRWQQRHPALSVGLITAATLLMVAGFALYYTERSSRLEQERLRDDTERLLHVSRLREAQSELRERNVRSALQTLNSTDETRRSFAWRHLKLRTEAHIQLWQVGDPNDNDYLHSLALSRDNKHIAFTTGLQKLRLARLRFGRLRVELETVADLALDFAADGKRVVLSASNGLRAEVFDTTDGTSKLRIQAADASAFYSCFGPAGAKLYSAASDGRVVVRDAVSGAVVESWRAHEETSKLDCRITMSPSRDVLVASCPGSAVSIWRLDGELVSRIRTRSSYSPAVSFTPDEREIVLAGYAVETSENFVVRYRVADGEELQAYNLDMPAIGALLHPRQNWLTAYGPAIVVVDAARGGRLRQFCGPTRPIVTAVFDRRAKLWTLARDGTLRRWSLSEPGYLSRVPGHRSAVTALACAREGAVLISGDSKGRLLFVDVDHKRRRVVDVCDARTQSIACVDDRVWAFFADGSAACYTSDGKERVALHELGEGLRLAVRTPRGWRTLHGASTLRAWNDAFERVEARDIEAGFKFECLANNASWLAVGGKGQIDLHPIGAPDTPASTAAEPRRLSFEGIPGTMCLRSDSRQLVASGRNADVWVYELGSDSRVKLGAHAIQTSAVAYLPGERFTISASWSAGLTIWDVLHGEQRARFTIGGMLLCQSVSPRGDYVAFGNIDGAVDVLWFERK